MRELRQPGSLPRVPALPTKRLELLRLASFFQKLFEVLAPYLDVVHQFHAGYRSVLDAAVDREDGRQRLQHWSNHRPDGSMVE